MKYTLLNLKIKKSNLVQHYFSSPTECRLVL